MALLVRPMTFLDFDRVVGPVIFIVAVLAALGHFAGQDVEVDVVGRDVAEIKGQFGHIFGRDIGIDVVPQAVHEEGIAQTEVLFAGLHRSS